MDAILVVDDEQSMREFLAIMLEKEGHTVQTASSGKAALKLMETEIFSLVITDIKMPGMSGIELLETIQRISPDTQVLMITAYGSTDNAVEAMKKGAFDYILKPFKIDEIKLIIRNALEQHHLTQENALLKEELYSRDGLKEIIGKSRAIRSVFQIIHKTAKSKSNVLISGESGTGKELVAKAIHRLSRRAEKPLVTINCGALPENLLESELFGYQRGAFTGAAENKKGLFEVAHGGSIFLDEIGEMKPTMQVKLLRVLQDQEFRRIGGTENITVDVRIIAASNQDFEKSVQEKRFREDLFYRLNVIPIHLPPLRDRREDIPILADHFLNKYAPGRKITVTQECIEILTNHPWQGNVRELENVIERTVVLLQGDQITMGNLPQMLIEGANPSGAVTAELPEDGLDFDRVIEEMEKDLLLKALEKSGGVKKEAARILQMSFRSFRYKLSKYELGRLEEAKKD